MAIKKDPYSFYARIYDRVVEPAVKKIRNAGLKVFPPQENLSILDVGCGTGTQLALYQETGCKLFGIDLSPAMLTMAQRRLGATADLHLADASHMTFASGTFDLVTIVLVLHEMPTGMRSAVLQECKRVVKADGRVMLIDYHLGPYPFPMGWVWKTFATVMEILAGREHYTNYRDFIARRGPETLIGEQQFTVMKRFIMDSGVEAIYLLKP